jgi:hypothetical protein
MVNKILFILVFLSAIATVDAQTRTNRLWRPCSGSVSPAKVEIERDGDIGMRVCTGRRIYLLDPEYSTPASAKTAFSVSSNDQIVQNLGVITADSHYFHSIFDSKVNASGANKLYANRYAYFSVGGSFTGGTIYGDWVTVNNELNEGNATVNIIGSQIDAVAESDTASVAGLNTTVYKGNANSSAFLTAIKGLAQNTYTNATDLIGGEFTSRTTQGGYTVTNATALKARVRNLVNSTPTITHARGLSLEGWSAHPGSTWTNSYGIYADTSIDVGTNRYFIYSLSTSPSVFSGNINIGGSGQLSIATPETPASASAACAQGAIRWDANYVYVCVAANTWKRSAISTW